MTQNGQLLILNRIFSTPTSIFKLSGSPGLALVLWVIAGIISTCGAMVLLEFGSGIPRSGGMKIYLERCFSPRLLMTCVYLLYCAILREFQFDDHNSGKRDLSYHHFLSQKPRLATQLQLHLIFSKLPQ